MAAGWSTTSSKNIEYTHKWKIENFDLAMVAGDGKIESGSFSIPGVAGEFHLAVHKQVEYIGLTDKDSRVIPTRVKVNGEEFDVNFYFSVYLKSTVDEGCVVVVGANGSGGCN